MDGDSIKHRNNSFFFWYYYPSSNHTEENCRKFIYSAYSYDEVHRKEREKTLDRLSKVYYAKGLLNYSSTHMPGIIPAERIDTWILAIVSSVAGRPDGRPPKSSTLDRNESSSMVILTQDDLSHPNWKIQIKGHIALVKVIARVFEPEYVMGYSDFNKWWDSHPSSEPPEMRIWPFNLFNLDNYDPLFKSRLEEFSQTNDDWILYYLDERYAILHLKDLSVPQNKNEERVTTELLGKDHEMLKSMHF